MLQALSMVPENAAGCGRRCPQRRPGKSDHHGKIAARSAPPTFSSNVAPQRANLFDNDINFKLKPLSYHINRPTMIPCQRPVPMSENDPRVPLKVPKAEGSVALNVELGGLKLWYLYTLLTSKRSWNFTRSPTIGNSLASEVCIQTKPGACRVFRPSVPGVKAAG